MRQSTQSFVVLLRSLLLSRFSCIWSTVSRQLFSSIRIGRRSSSTTIRNALIFCGNFFPDSSLGTPANVSLGTKFLKSSSSHHVTLTHSAYSCWSVVSIVNFWPLCFNHRGFHCVWFSWRHVESIHYARYLRFLSALPCTFRIEATVFWTGLWLKTTSVTFYANQRSKLIIFSTTIFLLSVL